MNTLNQEVRMTKQQRRILLDEATPRAEALVWGPAPRLVDRILLAAWFNFKLDFNSTLDLPRC